MKETYQGAPCRYCGGTTRLKKNRHCICYARRYQKNRLFVKGADWIAKENVELPDDEKPMSIADKIGIFVRWAKVMARSDARYLRIFTHSDSCRFDWVYIAISSGLNRGLSLIFVEKPKVGMPMLSYVVCPGFATRVVFDISEAILITKDWIDNAKPAATVCERLAAELVHTSEKECIEPKPLPMKYKKDFDNGFDGRFNE